MKLIVARHKESTGWTKSYDVCIVQKGKDLDNKGREPSSYLWYIINHWDELSGYYAFVQGWPFAHCLNLRDSLEEVDFKWIGDHPYTWNTSTGLINGDKLECKPFLEVNGLSYNYRYKRFFGGCQFILSAEQIKKKPQEYYKKMYDMLMTNEDSAWIFERFVDVIFSAEDWVIA